MLVAVGFLGLAAGAYGTAPVFIWLSSLHRPHHPVLFPFLSAVALLTPLVPIVLGAWAWRGRRVRKLISVYALVAGALGLGTGVLLGTVMLVISYVF